MGEQHAKHHISAGLLAHVGAGRREPHIDTQIPGPKTGDFSCPVKAKLFQGTKIPPYVVVSSKRKPHHMVVNFRDSALQPFSAPET